MQKCKNAQKNEPTTQLHIIRLCLFRSHEHVKGLNPPLPPLPLRKPGCSHSHESESIWCAEPLNLILTPAKPNWQLREPNTSPVPKPPDQWLAEGEGAGGTDLCVQHPWSSLCCVKYKKGQDGDSHWLALTKGPRVSRRFPGQAHFDEGSPSSKEMAVLSV